MQKQRLRKFLLLWVAALLSVMTGTAATLVQKNAFAYDIRVDAKTNPLVHTVSYKLNGTASTVVIEQYIGTSKVNTVTINGTPNTTDGLKDTNTVTMPTLLGKANGKVTYKIIVTTATPTTGIRIIQEGKNVNNKGVTWGLRFLRPLGVAVNNAPDSKSFGQIVVAEGNLNSNTTSTTYVSYTASNGSGAGLYALTPQLEVIKNTANGNKTGFKGGLTNTANLYGRLAFSQDGRLFMHSIANAGIYEFKSTNNTSASDAQGLHAGAVKLISLTKTTQGATEYAPLANPGVVGFDVTGSGANVNIAVTDVVTTATYGASTLQTYKIGTKTTAWTGNPTTTLGLGAGNNPRVMRPDFINLCWDKDGKGLALTARVGTGREKDDSYVHFKYDGSSTTSNYTPYNKNTYFDGQIQVAATSPDGKYIAVVKNPSSTASTTYQSWIYVYETNISNGTVNSISNPVLSLQLNTLGGNTLSNNNRTQDMAFDYANNLYIVNRDTETLSVYQLPIDGAVTVPAPADQAFTRNVTLTAASDLKAQVTGSTVTLNWKPGTVTQDEVAKQVVMYSADGGATWQQIEVAADATSCAIPGLAGGTYTFKVLTVAKNGMSAESATTTATVADGMALSYSALKWNGNKQTVKLTWTTIPETSTYRVYLNGTQVYETANGNTTKTLDMPMFAAGTAAADMKAEFEVVAVIDGVESTNAKQRVKIAVPNWVDYSDKTLEANAARTLIGDEQSILVSWLKPTQADLVKTYTIYRAPAKKNADNTFTATGAYVRVANVAGVLNTYNDNTTPEAGTDAFMYRVVANMTYGLKLADGTVRSTIESASEAAVDFTRTYGTVVLTSVKSFDGRQVIELEWENHGQVFTYYQIFRNGVLIGKSTAFTYIDNEVPVNDKEDARHTYYVVGVYTNGNTSSGSVMYATRSNEMQADGRVTRDPAVTRYGIEEVYNYPIVSIGEDTQGETNIVIPQGTIQNMKARAGTYGAPGDAYRQGVYKNGKWFLAQLTDALPTYHANGASQKDYFENSFTQDDLDGKHHGGIVEIEARDMLPGNLTAKRVFTDIPLFNQCLAIDQAKDDQYHFFTRGRATPTSTSLSQWNASPNRVLFYLGMPLLGYIKGSETTPFYKVGDKVEQQNPPAGLQFNGLTPLVMYKDQTTGLDQVNRVHYISADGRSEKYSSNVYMAANRTGDAYVMKVTNDGADGFKKYTAPTKDAEGNEISYISCTENYAYPIPGRDDFMHVIRNKGVYYVNGETGEYTQVYGGMNAYTAGGMTFQYNGHLFILNPTASRSNNSGHFRIDLTNAKVEEVDGEPKVDPNTGDYIFVDANEHDFLNMTPICSFTQQEMALWTAGNANGNWFGYEIDKDEDCVYIYQYVPGVRFAKYRFFMTNEFPAVTPTIELNVVYEANGEDVRNDNVGADKISHFDATFEWKRPEEFDYSTHADYTIDHYIAELFDGNMNTITAWNQDDNMYDKGEADKAINNGQTYICPPYRFVYDGTSLAQIIDGEEYELQPSKYIKALPGVRNVSDQTYLLRITPVYKYLRNERLIVGEMAQADNRTSYPVAIDKPRTKAFVDKTNRKFYRVDLDFDLHEAMNADGTRYKYEEPADYYTIEWSTDGGKTFGAVPALTIHYNGKSWDGGSDDAIEPDVFYMNGDYRFERDSHYQSNGSKALNAQVITDNYGERVPATGDNDKRYSNEKRDTEAGVISQAFKCVAFHTFEADHELSDSEWSNYVYRFTAHYATENPYIYKTAAVATSPTGTPVPTGVNDVKVDVDATAADGSVKAYPVPARTTLTVSATMAIDKIELFATGGKLVKSVKGNGTAKQTVNVADLAAGNYVLRVNGTHTLHIIKH